MDMTNTFTIVCILVGLSVPLVLGIGGLIWYVIDFIVTKIKERKKDEY